MLENLNPEKVLLGRAKIMPSILIPLTKALETGQDLKGTLEAIIHPLGFDSFMYGVGSSPRPNYETRTYVFTTLPNEWVARYDQAGYIEVDPRIANVWNCSVPFVWDQTTERGKDSRVDAFLDDALKYGVASGVAFRIPDPHAHAGIALNSRKLEFDEARRSKLADDLGDILMLGCYFHEMFVRSVVEAGIAPVLEGVPLSKREVQCLSHAARGLTTQDIAERLGLSARTVQFYFDGIRSKLAAANRQEAIAIALGRGLISI